MTYDVFERKQINRILELILPALERAKSYYWSPLYYVQTSAHLVLTLKVSLNLYLTVFF